MDTCEHDFCISRYAVAVQDSEEAMEVLWYRAATVLPAAATKNGNPRPGKLKMHRYVNSKLKAAILGAAMDAIRLDDNEFSEHYKRMVRNGVSETNARHTVGRKILTTMSGMWKSNTPYVAGLRN